LGERRSQFKNELNKQFKPIIGQTLQTSAWTELTHRLHQVWMQKYWAKSETLTGKPFGSPTTLSACSMYKVIKI
jgi:hypothetical protein